MTSFFNQVSEATRAILLALPAPRDPQPISYVGNELESAIAAMKPDFVRAIPMPGAAPVQTSEVPVGLNTVGMLLDRLSILCVKAWTLDVKRGAKEEADRLREVQIADIVAALDKATPGSSSVNTKTTTRVVFVEFSDFPSAYVGLLTTNLQLWEAQEVLYLRDLNSLDCSEIRGYVDFFSRGNIRRNAFIEGADAMYWKARGFFPKNGAGRGARQ